MFTNRVRTLSKPGLSRNATWRKAYTYLTHCGFVFHKSESPQSLSYYVSTVTPWRLWHGYNTMIIQSPQRRLNTAQSPYYVLYSVTQLYFNSQQTRYIVLYFRAATHPSVVSNKSVQCLSARQAHYMFQNMKPPLELLTQSLSLRSSQFQFSSSPAALCR